MKIFFGAILLLEDSILLLSHQNILNQELTGDFHHDNSSRRKEDINCSFSLSKDSIEMETSPSDLVFKIHPTLHNFLKYVVKTEMNESKSRRLLQEFSQIEEIHLKYAKIDRFSFHKYHPQSKAHALILSLGNIRSEEVPDETSSSERTLLSKLRKNLGSLSIKSHPISVKDKFYRRITGEKKIARVTFLKFSGLNVTLSDAKYTLSTYENGLERFDYHSGIIDSVEDIPENNEILFENAISVDHFYIVEKIVKDFGPQNGRMRVWLKYEDVFKLQN